MGLVTSSTVELGKKFEKTPGFGYVLLVTTAILGVLFKSTKPEEDWPVLLLALSATLVCYWLGGLIDDILFEPLFGLPKDQSRAARAIGDGVRAIGTRFPGAKPMHNARQEAATKFQSQSGLGIYKTGKQVLLGTDIWDGRIGLSLDFSKFARTLSVPLIALVIWEVVSLWPQMDGPTFLTKYNQLAWLSNPLLAAVTSAALLLLYVYLRLVHMRLVYQKLVGVRQFKFRAQCVGVQPDSWVTLWAIGDRVIADDHLEIRIQDKLAISKEQPQHTREADVQMQPR